MLFDSRWVAIGNLMRSVLSLNILLENPPNTLQKGPSFQKHQHELPQNSWKLNNISQY
jgi:hypothetical protein